MTLVAAILKRDIGIYIIKYFLLTSFLIHVFKCEMRRKKERSKQGQTNKQGKATQHTQGSEKKASGGTRTHDTSRGIGSTWYWFNWYWFKVVWVHVVWVQRGMVMGSCGMGSTWYGLFMWYGFNQVVFINSPHARYPRPLPTILSFHGWR